MLATFFIEVFLIVYTLWRYKLTNVTKLVIAIFGLLASFQLAEYMICGGLGMSGDMWARLGFIVITLLPPLGIHLAVTIAGGKHKLLTMLGYGLAALFAAFFMVVTSSVEHKLCGGNYVIFDMPNSMDIVYGVYYYGLLIVGTVYSFIQASKSKKKTKVALRSLAIGYLVFLVPTTAANLTNASTIGAIPSIMCGFAILLALVLAFWVLPNAAELRHKSGNFWERMRK